MCVVFISKFDIFEGNLPLYHVDRVVRETEGGLNIMCEIIEKITTEAKNEGKLETLFGLVKDGILTIAEAASRADMSEAAFTENMQHFHS
jgi:hypothetical protein